ncbi:MAG: hypothetical protein IT526_00650 [Nitrosomonas sp.]|nr:hypothetical protein [Nitrosomonas sp.]
MGNTVLTNGIHWQSDFVVLSVKITNKSRSHISPKNTTTSRMVETNHQILTGFLNSTGFSAYPSLKTWVGEMRERTLWNNMAVDLDHRSYPTLTNDQGTSEKHQRGSQLKAKIGDASKTQQTAVRLTRRARRSRHRVKSGVYT